MNMKYLATILILFNIMFAQSQKKYKANWKSLDSRPVAPWFADAKFGIFIHWGLYSVPAWSAKGTYAPKNPTKGRRGSVWQRLFIRNDPL